MASSEDSDDSAEDGPEYNAIIQPPLIKQLKKILDEYPDDGQILKEIIQNAEDAEASQMKILFDERPVNSELSGGTKEKKFKKYFKGPALCVYNNAKFTKEDWQGIQMINSSVKEYDPVKIGRFGLGFKSVFHITDYPMIISGNRMLVLDPHQKNANHVCINMKLNKLHKYKKQLDISYCLNALDGLFDFSQETLDSGEFNGTLFRFPLRDVKTNLSDNVYDIAKISDLFNAFKAEASVELLFLNCIEKIELYDKDGYKLHKSDEPPFFTVKISESCLDDVRAKRSEFHTHMQSVGRKIAEQTFSTKVDVKIETQSGSGNNADQSWFVLHCLKGGNLSQELATLSQDEALSNSPYVSIAVPKDMDTDFKGHVFCLMPLPLEDESLTGYPIHVNGHFALSQNRRHVKWPTADQVRNKAHIDKSIRWNNCLLVEVLAGVYHDVIQDLLQTCKANGNRKEDLDRLYRSIPDHRTITSHWDLICEPFFQTFLQTACLFSDSFGGKWIHPKDAVFKIFDPNVSEVTQETICRLMQACCIELVDVPEHIVAVLRHRKYSVQTLSQEFIRTCMTSDTSYKSFSCEDKFSILNFLVSDGNYSILSGLELLPLENGSFCTFYNNKNNRVFICKDEVALFPGQEEKFIKQGLKDEMNNHVYMMASKGLYQVVILQNQSASEIASLLQTTITKYIGSTSNREIQWRSSAPVGMNWLEKVWSYIQRYDLSYFSNLHLMPDTRTNEMYKVCVGFILKTKGHNGIPSSVCDCLRYLDIVVLEQIPSAIEEHKNIRNFVYLPTKEDVFRMLIKIQAGGNVNHLVNKFNTTITAEERSQFVTYISGYSITDNQLINLLSSMNLFTEKNSRRHVSASQVRTIADTDQLPVLYFKETLDCSDQKYRDVATKLHAKTITKEDVIIDILKNLIDQYHTADINKMMGYVLNNLPYFHMKEQMIRIAREIPFVFTSGRQMKKASDLFDPEDDTLKMIILDNDRFPNVQNLPVELKLLRKLGLKSLQDITGEDILSCARYLHTSNRCTENKRSEELLKVLVNKSGLLSSYVSGQKLSNHLSSLRFIGPSERKDDFPKSLPWYTDTADSFFCRPCDLSSPKFTKMIGSVKPVVSPSSSSLIASAGWTIEPGVTYVIDQLLIITERYEDKYKPELLPVISDIYHFMANHYNSQDFQRLSNKKWIWTGTGFEEPEKVYLQTKSSDLVLRPYLYPLPDEFRGSNLLQFFRKIQCLERQTTDLLIRVEKMIQTEYCGGGGKSEERAKADLQLVVNILNSIKDDKNIEGVLLPIKQCDETLLILKPASECNYCKDDDELFGDEQFFVHHDVSPETAEKLGVPSVTDTLLEDAERLDEWGQSEPLTRRIKNLLESYKDGLSVPKEIIQNADDAGATKVCFMYDEREKENYGKKLLDKNMLECQGPSLWAYNNAKFTNEDLLNITKVSGATKGIDTTKIGKFGLGFCSVYNLTEVPSFITGDHMVIFDPHSDYLADALKHKKQPGLKIHMQRNRKIMMRKHSQFEPFNGVFGCNLDTSQKEITFEGTLFRLPLRTRQQAVSSEISNIPYDNEQMISLMKIFIEAGGNLLLFSQNVVEVEFYHLPRNEKDPTNAVKLYSVRKDFVRTIGRPIHQSQSYNTFSVLKEMTLQFENVKKGVAKNTSMVDLSILIQVSVEANSKLINFKITSCSSSTSWIVTWASGTSRSKDLALKSSTKRVLPLGSVACPVTKTEEGLYKTCSLKDLPSGFYHISHVFCYLPLPVETSFPVHVNGSFAVTSDRRRLSCKTVDDKDSFDSDWNEGLMGDAVCNAYILFLENRIDLGLDNNEPYFQHWPVQYGKDGNFGKLQTAFYQQISDRQRNAQVFRRDNKITSITYCQFLDSTLMETKFGEEAFNVCVKFLEDDNTKIMKLPRDIQNSFRDAGCVDVVKQRTLNNIAFFSKLVFPHLTDDVWAQNIMDILMLYAIDNASDEMCNLLKEHRCIPTAPNRVLRHPSELVDRKGLLNSLFKEEDERFVMLDLNTYSKPTRLVTLARLGMTTTKLTENLLIDRAKSILSLAETCPHCALDRCVQFVRYLNREITSIEPNHQLFSDLKSIQFLPVKSKSKEWEWSWGGDSITKSIESSGIQYKCINENHNQSITVQFESPQKLYSNTVLELVCSIRPVLDRLCLPMDIYAQFFGKLGVMNNVSPSLALENLLVISTDFGKTEKRSTKSESIASTVFAIYKFLNETFTKQIHSDEKAQKSLIQTADRFRNENILLLNGTFVKPCQVVVQISEDCSPDFYGLNVAYNLKQMKGLLKLLQIDDRCSAERVLSKLEMYKTKYGAKEMDEDEVKLYVRLLKVLVSSMKLDNLNADSVQDLFIPDTKGILHPIQNVCLDESTVNSTETMHFTHDSISHEIAKVLGINTKRKHKVEECSKDLYSQDFGQHEELLTRIKRILDGYPFDVCILKELLQNADDAKASEVHIVVDFNNHPTDDLFDEMWKPLQGPALLVFNDSYFTEADIAGIQNLGVGSKGDDPTKTGQYGVGFNAVYHLTDVPSFLSRGQHVETGEVLCIFDPHCHYVPKATGRNPGRKYVNTKTLKEDHPNVFSCYHDNLLMNNQGTIFRLPLRTEKFTKKSQISNSIVTAEGVRRLLEDFKKEMSEMLLFVNNVKSIKLSEIVGGKLEEIYSVMLKMSSADESKRTEFNNAIGQASKIMNETKNPDCLSSTEMKYQVQINDSCGKMMKWLIVRRLGFSKKGTCPDTIKKAYQKGDIGLLPRGGVALPIFEKDQECVMEHGRVFCSLPLPLESGLPIHFNGHFALDHEARRSLYTDDQEGYHVVWNKHLLEDIIAPSYTTGLLEMKELLGLKTDSQVNELQLHKQLSRFHGYFPEFEKAKNDYFKFLTCSIYRWINSNEVPLFASAKMVSNSEAHVNFYPLYCSKNTFQSVFNTMKKQQISSSTVATIGAVGSGISEKIASLKEEAHKTRDDRVPSLVHIFKELGIKLLDAPKHVLRSIKEAKIEVCEINPEFLMCFLKSFNVSAIDTCNLGGVDCSIEETTFKKVSHLVLCISYCKKSDLFIQHLNGLPFCLTEDGILRTFKRESPVFCTNYSTILKESASLFLHHDLTDLFTITHDGLKEFDLNAFAEFLPATLASEVYRTHNRPVVWSTHRDSVVNMTWLSRVWDFINHTVQLNVDKSAAIDTRNLDSVFERMNPLMPWCLIPCTQSVQPFVEDIKEHVLFPVSKLRYTVNLSTYNGSIEKALKRLALPCLDPSFKVDQRFILTAMLVSDKDPCALIDFLYEYKEEIRNRNITPEVCTDILEYFSEHIERISENVNVEAFLNKIRQIPLHVNVSGHNISLDSNASVLVLSDYVSNKIVLDGVEEWANASDTILLKATHHLTKLYAKIGFTAEKLEAIDVYTNHLLRTFDCLPKENHQAHLVFIRDTLLAKSSLFNTQQNHLIDVLKKVSFVEGNDGILFTASHFKDPCNELLKLMCDPNDFPGGVFSANCWLEFLVIAGIQTQVTSNMVLQFARSIEEEVGQKGVTEEISKKSELLTKHVLSRHNIEKEGILNEISSIKFIVPCKITDWKNKIFPQKHGLTVCYRESVPRYKADLCWTTCNIIPDKAKPYYSIDPKKQLSVVSQLGILNEPPFRSVISHVQNICDALKGFADKNLIQDASIVLIKEMMLKIYDWLNENHDKDIDHFKKSLIHTPLVFKSERKLFVTCVRTVKSLDKKKEHEIVPYLLETPEEYGKYFKLFQILGMNLNTDLSTYVRVLVDLKYDIGDRKLNPNLLKIVQRSVEEILSFRADVDEHVFDALEKMEALYLLTREKQLMNASNLVFSDNEDFEEKIGNDIGKPYMMGFDRLDVSAHGNIVSSFKQLPKKMQPCILSDMITSEIDEESFNKINDRRGQLLREFLASPQFQEAIVRISVHCRKDLKLPKMKEDDAKAMVNGIENIQIVQVESIKQRLTYKGKTVGQDELTAYCQSQDETSQHTLFCAFNEYKIQEWLSESFLKISEVLSKCTNYLFCDTKGFLMTVLNFIENPNSITKALDRARVEQYSISKKSRKSVFPPAGVTVHEEWHCFLDNSFSDFDVGDYVALLLSEEKMDGDRFIPAVYIYAIVVGKVESGETIPIIGNSLRYYLVDVGNQRIEKKRAYDCFKFNCSIPEKSNELVVFLDISDTQKDERPLDDILKDVKEKIKAAWTLPEDERKKIIKRFFKKWHPDKNHGNEKIATEVFKFIKNLVLQMENGEDVDANTNSNFKQPPRNSTFWEHFRTWERDTTEDKNNSEQRSQSSGCGTSSGRRQDKQEVPSVAEARQWMRQAKLDFTAAKQFLPSAETGPHFNWICIMCYQTAMMFQVQMICCSYLPAWAKDYKRW
ncbi:sacsin-like isoform X2 [Mytilus galloprovincialis]|uniref:sacsin-like isoform X2 n=1 Tax=Mytilus galloprovincialis TaxID=29158 RepID=UPI003F7C39F0